MNQTEQTKLFHKDFTLVVIGQIISLFGNGIVRFALPLYLLNQTGSASLYGIVSALSFLPMIILTPIGGIIADRVNKRNVMVTLDFMTAGLMTVLYILLGSVDIVPLFIITLMLLYGIFGAYQPTVQASMPLMQSKENLLPANAIINQVGALANLLAPVLGGLLFGIWGLTPIIIVGGGCFFVSAVMEIFIYIPYEKKQTNQNVFSIVKQDLSESFKYIIKDNPVIFKSIGVIFGFNMFVSSLIMVSAAVLITQVLGISDELYGLSQGAMAAGGLAGGIFAGLFAKKLQVKNVYLLLLLASLLLLPISLVFWLGLPSFVCYLVITISCFCIMGVATVVSVQLISFVQGETPSHLIGKVISCIMALCMCAQPLGQTAYGILFDMFFGTPQFIVLGAAIAASVISIFSKNIFKSL